jgi:large subunit ribosomal protein L24
MQTLRPVTKPAKQRKRVFQAPDHIRHKLFAAPLSSELKASQGTKTLPVRSGDTVRIVRGDHKGFEGKISRVDRRKYRIYVEGLTREKVDGTAIFVPVHPSKVMITNLALDDKWRKKVIERKKEARKKAIEVAEKPAKKVEEVKEEAVAEKVIVKEKPKARKPRTTRKKVVKKAPTEKAEKEKAEVEVEEKPKAEKTRAKRKTTKKDEGGA